MTLINLVRIHIWGANFADLRHAEENYLSSCFSLLPAGMKAA